MSLRAGNYVIEQTLSTGGMATIHLGRHAGLGRRVVIKQLHPHLSRDGGFVRRFEREAKILGALHHPNIVDVLDYFEQQGSYYIVLEHVDGGSLRDLLDRQRRLPFQIAVLAVIQVCEGLRHAHENGIIHRDIKPGNVLLSRAGPVKLTDFGLAHAAEAAAITDPGTFVGTPAYLAPEQIRGRPSGPSSDLYALGVVLYEALDGTNPFAGANHSESIDRTLRFVPRRIPGAEPEIPPGLVRIVLRLLAKSPDQRHRSCADLMADLSQYRLVKPEALTRYLADPAGYRPRQEDQDEISRLVRREKRALLLARAASYALLALLAGAAGTFAIRRGREHLQQLAQRRAAPADTIREAPPAAAAASRQLLRILGTEGAEISVNGRRRGPVPAILDDLAPGRVELLVSKPGHQPQRRTVALDAGGSQTITFILAPLARAPGYLLLTARPWAELYVDGRFIDRTPLPAPVRLAAGEHELLLRHPNRREYARTVSIEPAETVRVDVTMPEAFGQLLLTVSPWARAYIDGVDLGVSPFGDPFTLSIGEHELRLVGADGRERRETVIIREGQTTELQVTMP